MSVVVILLPSKDVGGRGGHANIELLVNRAVLCKLWSVNYVYEGDSKLCTQQFFNINFRSLTL